MQPVPPSAYPVAGRAKSRKRIGCLVAGVALVVLLLVALTLLTLVMRPASVNAEGPVQDGKLRFTVNALTCPKAAGKAATRKCRLAVKVSNIGIEARVLYPGQQKIVDDDDAKHGAAKLLDKSGAETTPVRLGPGDSFTGALLFELPRKIRPVLVELHDSGLSGGVRVTLSDKA